MKDVFISYSHADEGFAKDLADRLERDRVTTWMDYKDAGWGKSFPAEVEAGIDNTRHILCIISKHWAASAWYGLERYSAMVDDPNAFLGKLLLVLRADKESIPHFMRPLAYIDCTGPNSLDKQYPCIHDHIRGTRPGASSQTAGLPPLIQAGGTHLPPLSYVFVVGHPASGKSTFCRFLQEYLSKQGVSVEKCSEYPFLQALFRLDVARGDEKRFEPDSSSEFKVKDMTVFDEVLKLIHDEIIVSAVAPESLRVIEFSRARYDSSFLHYTLKGLVNSAIVHVDTPLSKCEARNDSRRKLLERKSAGVESPGDEFDHDPDVHYVPPSVYERYPDDAQNWNDQALLLSLMPARAYLRLSNVGDSLEEYKAKCHAFIQEHLLSLIAAPEKLDDYYNRRIRLLQRFVSDATNGKNG